MKKRSRIGRIFLSMFLSMKLLSACASGKQLTKEEISSATDRNWAEIQLDNKKAQDWLKFALENLKEIKKYVGSLERGEIKLEELALAEMKISRNVLPALYQLQDYGIDLRKEIKEAEELKEILNNMLKELENNPHVYEIRDT